MIGNVVTIILSGILSGKIIRAMSTNRKQKSNIFLQKFVERRLFHMVYPDGTVRFRFTLG
jgi:hypothetical protein